MTFDFFDPAMLMMEATAQVPLSDHGAELVIVQMSTPTDDIFGSSQMPVNDELLFHSDLVSGTSEISKEPSSRFANIFLLESGDDSDSNGDGVHDEIIVTGKRRNNELVGSEPSGEGGTGSTAGTGGGGGGGGSGGSVPVVPHTDDCGSPSGAAVQVADKVIGTDPYGPPNPVLSGTGRDWVYVEFGAVITKNLDGTYGALNDQIYSNDSTSIIIFPSAAGTQAVGIWHNHPTDNNVQADAVNRYPSFYSNAPDDWDALAAFAKQVALNNSSFDPSLWITDPAGITREFKLSERAYYEALSKDQMEKPDGEGLQGKERTKSCS